ncbi:MAG TPA: hypothetical protein VLW85_06100 [Myxococcales bacterium]|nr:hypothetical protein [Myxococcales bacterium]
MTKRTGRRQSRLERKATRHQDFVGSADADRAESEFREHERIERDRMQHDHSPGPEIPFRLPRPEELREKARERLSGMPQPVQRAAELAGIVMQVAMVPVRIGLGIARELVKLPFSLLRATREA